MFQDPANKTSTHSVWGEASGWIQALAKVGKFISPGAEALKGYDPYGDAIKAVGEWINHQDGVSYSVKEFMDKAYFEEGKLYRRSEIISST